MIQSLVLVDRDESKCQGIPRDSLAARRTTSAQSRIALHILAKPHLISLATDTSSENDIILCSIYVVWLVEVRFEGRKARRVLTKIVLCGSAQRRMEEDWHRFQWGHCVHKARITIPAALDGTEGAT